MKALHVLVETDLNTLRRQDLATAEIPNQNFTFPYKSKLEKALLVFVATGSRQQKYSRIFCILFMIHTHLAVHVVAQSRRP